jgi:hypothetical protein
LANPEMAGKHLYAKIITENKPTVFDTLRERQKYILLSKVKDLLKQILMAGFTLNSFRVKTVNRLFFSLVKL